MRETAHRTFSVVRVAEGTDSPLLPQSLTTSESCIFQFPLTFVFEHKSTCPRIRPSVTNGDRVSLGWTKPVMASVGSAEGMLGSRLDPAPAALLSGQVPQPPNFFKRFWKPNEIKFAKYLAHSQHSKC